MNDNNGNGRVRARARATHVYLSEGLVEEAEAELALLLDELGVAVEALPAKSTGGGVRKGPSRATKKRVARAKAPGPVATDKPKRLPPEQEAELMAERRAQRGAEDLPAPVSENRSARAFTQEERARVAEYARDETITKACEVFNLSWPCVRDWIDKYPRRSTVPA